MRIKANNTQIIKVFIIFIISIFACFLIKYKAKVPLLINYELNSPSGVFEGNNKKLYIIDGAKKKILVLDNKKLKTIIKGSKEKNGFYYASLVCDDKDGNIYIADTVYSEEGTTISKERILKYDSKGNFKENIFEIKYETKSESPSQYGNILSMREKNNKLVFSIKEKSDIRVIELDLKSRNQNEQKYNYKNMNISSVDINLTTLNPNIITRKGDIFKLNSKEEINVLLGHENVGTPWKISGTNEKIYYTDLESKEIKEILGQGIVKTIYKSENILYTVFENEGKIYSTDYIGIIILDKDKVEYLTKFKSENIYGVIVFYVFLLSSLLSFLYLILQGVYKLKDIIKSDAIQKSLIIIIVSVLVTILVSYLTLNPMMTYVNKDTMKKLNLFGDMLIESTSVEDLNKITSISDYREAPYLKVKNTLDMMVEKSYENGIYYYYILYKTDGKTIYGIMDYEDTMTSYHPFYSWEENSYTDVFKDGKVFEFSNDVSAYGTWSFVLKPVLDKNNKTVAVMEVGINTDELKKNQRQLLKEIVTAISCSVIIMIIVMLEIIFILKYKERKTNLEKENKNLINFRFPVRSLIFISFFSDSMQDSFMPILSHKRYESFVNIPESIGIALPITLQLLFSALFSFLGGTIISRIGIKKTMIIGFLSQITGYIICAYTSGFTGLLIGKVIVGIGMGLIIVTVNTIGALAENDIDSAVSFGEINAGILAGVTAGVGIGAVVLSVWNYSGVYYVAAGIVLVGLIITVIGEDYMPALNKKSKGTIDIYKFMLDKKVITFLILVLTPFLVALSYREYFFPLYAESMGLSEVYIGYLYLICGVIVIYLGPLLTTTFITKIGLKRTLVLSSSLMCSTAIIFAIMPSLITAIIGIISLSIAISFGYATQSTYYTSLSAVSDYGEARAMGVYAVFDSGGQTIGPLVYGSIILLGYRRGMIVIGGFLTIFILMFILTNLKRGETDV